MSINNSVFISFYYNLPCLASIAMPPCLSTDTSHLATLLIVHCASNLIHGFLYLVKLFLKSLFIY